ncbi:MAG: right-handed parallel beta-helix repeat-containing protein [Candidatus Bathyarchaeota archaeon]|nr:right-handed parallel beta-helix repeat-containing protein [Candidatus Bathyarchaeum sp.]
MKTSSRSLVSSVFLFLMSSFLFVSAASANYYPDPGPDIPRIYIRNSGDVEPATGLIEKTGNIYKLTGNITNYTLEIQCDNIVLDGNGYAIQGNASRIKGYGDGNNGVVVDNQKNVTIKNIAFEQGETGARISTCSSINIIGCSFSNGICTGILIQDSIQILIENNNLIELNTGFGAPAVMLNGAQITLRNNTVIGSGYGITITGSSNLITENTFECLLPIEMDTANANIISLNTISGPTSWPGQDSVTGWEGIMLDRLCSNNLIFGNTITGFSGQAIRTISSCSNNTFYGNYIANTGTAIVLQDGATDNTFYGNVFASDSCIVRIDDGVEGTSWDNGTIGNYWRDYNGTDVNEDGIGDTPYTITAVTWDTDTGSDVNFVTGYDNYPLMEPITVPEFSSWTILPVFLTVTSVVLLFRNKSC